MCPRADSVTAAWRTGVTVYVCVGTNNTAIFRVGGDIECTHEAARIAIAPTQADIAQKLGDTGGFRSKLLSKPPKAGSEAVNRGGSADSATMPFDIKSGERAITIRVIVDGSYIEGFVAGGRANLVAAARDGSVRLQSRYVPYAHRFCSFARFFLMDLLACRATLPQDHLVSLHHRRGRFIMGLGQTWTLKSGLFRFSAKRILCIN